ncbi:MAG: acetylornithine transaminase [Chloroflexota bacterium]|nr:acetylornithine transaminase [Chloroflexota bacterium]
MSHWQELERKYYMQTFERVPLTIVRGQGARVWDEDGKEYLDFVGGWAANILGHCHPAVCEAVTKQVQTLIHASNTFYTIPQIQLAELLVKNSCFHKVFFGNSGLEANEGAFKLARRYGKLNLKGAYEIITANDSFHGRSLATIAATGQPKHQQPFTPMPAGFVNVPFNDIEVIKKATTPQTCAVMLEPLQGEGGVTAAHEDYLRAVRAWCDQKGILLILDEIQTGLGRTGTLFAYEQYGIEPDIMTLAKGLAGGLPIGALLAKDKAAVFTPGEHGSTYGGNPVACAAGVAALTFILEQDVPANCRKMGQRLMAGLQSLKTKYPFVTDVRGRGLLQAMEFNRNIAESVKVACMGRRLLVNRLKPNTLRFMPPLIINRDDVAEALGILDEVLGSDKLEPSADNH